MAPQPEGWLYREKSGSQVGGPNGYFTDSQILVEVNEGRLTSECIAWHAKHTSGDWKEASKIKAFAERFAAGEEFRNAKAIADAIAARKEELDRKERFAADQAAAARLLKQRQEEAEHSKMGQKADSHTQVQGASDPGIPADLMPLAAKLDRLIEEQNRCNRWTMGSHAILFFLLFLFLGGCSAYFSVFRYDDLMGGNPAAGWFAFGAFIAFCAWFWRLIASMSL